METSPQPRSPLAVTLGVWNALFLREAVDRVSRQRAAWLWLLLEPVAHIVFLMFVFATFRVRVLSGIDVAVWIMVGLLSFFMFRRPAAQAATVMSNNQVLFAYRQVKPVDAVLVRAVLEGFLMTIIAFILLTATGLYGLPSIPSEPMTVVGGFFGLWLYGLGYMLIASVAVVVVPELGRVLMLALLPLYLISGVMFPVSIIPPVYREWLLINPVLHGLEVTRAGFGTHYQVVAGVSMTYLYGCAIIAVFLGLALHRYFARRLAAQ
jgi:capsular polysaccharide transport system permease protein